MDKVGFYGDNMTVTQGLESGEDVMLLTSGERIHYLSLALDARKAIKALCKLVETGQANPELKRSIGDVVAYLNAVKGGGDLYAHLAGRSSFEHFEQIQTLDEVKNALNDERLTANLKSVLAAKNDKSRREGAKYAIGFFSKLEARALHHYNQPPDDHIGF